MFDVQTDCLMGALGERARYVICFLCADVSIFGLFSEQKYLLIGIDRKIVFAFYAPFFCAETANLNF